MTEPSAPLAPEAAAAQITALKQDRGFSARWNHPDAAINGDARAQMAGLLKAAHPDTPAGAPAAAPAASAPAAAPATDTAARDAARAQLAAKKADPAAVKRYFEGDSAEKAEWARLHEAAYPGDSTDGKGVPGAVGERTDEPAASAAGDDYVPADPSRYRFQYPHGEEVDKQLDAEFRQAAHGARWPESLARYAFNAYNRAAIEAKKAGKGLSDGELQLKTASTAAKLQARWGDQYAAKLDAAKSLVRAIPEAQRARAVHLIERSGLGADQHFIIQLADLAARRAKAQA